MAFIWLILAGFVLGMSFNVFALLAFSILAFFACFAAEVHTGLFPAILVAFAVLPTVQFGYVLGVLALSASSYVYALRPGVRRGQSR